MEEFPISRTAVDNTFVYSRTHINPLFVHSEKKMSGRPRNSNPFYATTKSIAELALEARKQVSAGKKAAVPQEKEATAATYHYSTVSSNYGTQIANNKNFISLAMDPLRTKDTYNPELHNTMPKPLPFEMPPERGPEVNDQDMATRMARANAWQFRAPKQNPMYTTSAHEIGYKAPSAHEFPDKKFPVQNEFSNTFNGIQNRDQGLNCSVTRNRIIDKGENAW